MKLTSLAVQTLFNNQSVFELPEISNSAALVQELLNQDSIAVNPLEIGKHEQIQK
jgi:hypothetical protein